MYLDCIVRCREVVFSTLTDRFDTANDTFGRGVATMLGFTQVINSVVKPTTGLPLGVGDRYPLLYFVFPAIATFSDCSELNPDYGFFHPPVTFCGSNCLNNYRIQEN